MNASVWMFTKSRFRVHNCYFFIIMIRNSLQPQKSKLSIKQKNNQATKIRLCYLMTYYKVEVNQFFKCYFQLLIYFNNCKTTMDFFSQQSAQTAQMISEQPPLKIFRRILAEKKGYAQTVYQVQWIIENKVETSWLPLSQLADHMTEVAQFKIKQKLQRNSKTLDLIPQVPQNEQESIRSAASLSKSYREHYKNEEGFQHSAIVAIHSLAEQSPDRYQIQLLDKLTNRLSLLVLTSADLKQKFLEDYVNYLQHEVYYAKR